MAGFGDIPLKAGFTSMGELADLMMEKRKMEQMRHLEEMKNAQRAKEAEQTAKYNQGMLNVHQNAENRLQKMSPFEIQKAQGEIAKSKQQQDFMNDLRNGQSTSLFDSLTNAQAQATQPQDQGQNQPLAQASPQMQQPMEGGGSFQSPEMGGGGPPGGDTQQQQPAQPEQPQGQPQGLPQKPSLQTLKQGQRMVLAPPQDKTKAGWDRYAGMNIGGVKIPDTQSRVEDGIEYRTYPSGMQVATKVGPSYEEKLAFAEKAKEERAAANLNEKDKIKRRGDIRAASKNFMTLLEHASNIDQILEEHPNITGLGTPLKVKAGFGSGPQGRLQANIMPLVGPLAKQMSDRGGAAVAGFAATGKPGLGNAPDYNKEMTSEIIKEGLRTFDMLKQEYEELGMKFPYELPKRLGETINVKDNETGKVTKMTRADFIRLEGQNNG